MNEREYEEYLVERYKELFKEHEANKRASQEEGH